MIGTADAFPLFFQAVYYLFVPDWFYVHAVGIAGAVVVVGFVAVIPESPKYMYANRRFDETKEILKVIAKKNKADITSEEIDKIVFEFQETN